MYQHSRHPSSAPQVYHFLTWQAKLYILRQDPWLSCTSPLQQSPKCTTSALQDDMRSHCWESEGLVVAYDSFRPYPNIWMLFDCPIRMANPAVSFLSNTGKLGLLKVDRVMTRDILRGPSLSLSEAACKTPTPSTIPGTTDP
jgi:hypothetical protein